MIIYEVNIDVPSDMFDAYIAWLRPHMAEMQRLIRGLVAMRITTRPPFTEPTPPANGSDASATVVWRGITALYEIETCEALDEYVATHAAAMRQDAMDKFGAERIRANRRVLEVMP